MSGFCLGYRGVKIYLQINKLKKNLKHISAPSSNKKIDCFKCSDSDFVNNSLEWRMENVMAQPKLNPVDTG